MIQDECWMIQYREVVEFMVKKDCKPSKYYPEKLLMLHFIHHNKKLYNAGEMKPERMVAFEKLLALCKEYKRVNQYA